jgi:hypothetical protein
MPSGARSIRADRSRLWERVPSQPVVLLGRLVDSRLGFEARIGVYHSMPENPRPTLKPKESVAWKRYRKQ